MTDREITVIFVPHKPGRIPYSRRVERCPRCRRELTTHAYLDPAGMIARILPAHPPCPRSLTALPFSPRHPRPPRMRTIPQPQSAAAGDAHASQPALL